MQTLDQQRAAASQMGELGAQVTRITIHFEMVARLCPDAPLATLADPDAPCYRWTEPDQSIGLARAQGLTVIVSVFGLPEWANGGGNAAWTGATSAEADVAIERFARFSRAAATRYGPDSTVGHVRHWTVWNEPNSAYFWQPFDGQAVARYAQLYARAAGEIRAAQPDSLIAPGPTGPNSTTKPGLWIPRVQSALLARDASSLVDAWAHNPYPGGKGSPRIAQIRLPAIGIGNFADLITLLDASSVTSGKPIWVTEFAYQTNPPDPASGVSLTDQARFLAEALDIVWTSGRVTLFNWYLLQDGNGDPAADWDSGLLDRTGSPKPAARMFTRPVALHPGAEGTFRVWGMSLKDASSATLVTAPTASGPWRRLQGQQQHGGSGVVTAGTTHPDAWVAVRDARGVGTAVATRPAINAGSGGASVARRLQLRHGGPSRQARTCGRSLRAACGRRLGRPVWLQISVSAGVPVRATVTFERRIRGRWRPVATTHVRATATGRWLRAPADLAARRGAWRARATAGSRARLVSPRVYGLTLAARRGR